MSETPVEDMTFEQAMSELERVVGQLERGDVALISQSHFMNVGIAEKALRSEIEGSRRKVAAITLDATGTPTGTAPLDGA